MGVRIGRLREVVAGFGERGQSKAARAMGLSKSSLSRILGSEDAAERVSWRTALRIADGTGTPFEELWTGEIPATANAELKVPRGTIGAVRERPSHLYGAPELAVQDVRNALAALEQMALSLAHLARRTRDSMERK